MKRSKLIILLFILILILLPILYLYKSAQIVERFSTCPENNILSNLTNADCRRAAKIAGVFGVGVGVNSKVTVGGQTVDVDFNRLATTSDFPNQINGQAKKYQLQKGDPETGKTRCFSIFQLNDTAKTKTPGFTSCVNEPAKPATRSTPAKPAINNGWPNFYIQKLGTDAGVFQLRVQDRSFDGGGGKCIIHNGTTISYAMCNSNTQPLKNWKIYKFKDDTKPRQFKIVTNDTAQQALYFNARTTNPNNGLTGQNDTEDAPIRRLGLYPSTMPGTAINIK